MADAVRPLAVVVALLVVAGCDATPRQVSRSPLGAFEASLTALADGFAVAWYDTRDGHPEIYSRLLDTKGRPRGAELRLTRGTDASYEADIQAIQNDLAVAWYETTASGELRARLGRWSRDGQVRWTRTISAAERNGRNPVVRVNGAALFCAWLEDTADDSDVWTGWWDGDGHSLSPPQRLARAGRTTWNLNSRIDAQGRVWVVFDAKVDTRSEELFLARVDETASDVVRLTSDDGFPSKYPDLVFGGDRVALTWFDERDGNKEVYLAVAPLHELPEELEAIEHRARRITTTPGESIGAYSGWNGRRFGLSWSDDSRDGQHEVYFQSFDAEGRPVVEAQRLTHNKTSSLIPAIQPWADTFALAWNEYTRQPQGAHESGGRSQVVFAVVR